MCGRYTLAHTHKEIMERFGLEQMSLDFDARYNIAPSQLVPIIIEQKLESEEKPRRILQQCQWGLVPGWVKDPRLLRPMINARGETILEKRTFKSAFLQRRCLIPADGFYEWFTEKKKRLPVRFQINGGELFAFAGIYEEGKTPEGEIKRTCAIITVAANEKVSGIHDRMPAILKRNDESLWLNKDQEDPAELLSLINPCANEAIDYYRCSSVVNSAKLDTAECIEHAPQADSDPNESGAVQLKLEITN